MTAHIETFILEWDEDGLILHLGDSKGEHHRFNVSAVAERVYDHSKSVIGPWLYERALAESEYQLRTRGGEKWNPETRQMEPSVEAADHE